MHMIYKFSGQDQVANNPHKLIAFECSSIILAGLHRQTSSYGIALTDLGGFLRTTHNG